MLSIEPIVSDVSAQPNVIEPIVSAQPNVPDPIVNAPSTRTIRTRQPSVLLRDFICNVVPHLSPANHSPVVSVLLKKYIPAIPARRPSERLFVTIRARAPRRTSRTSSRFVFCEGSVSREIRSPSSSSRNSDLTKELLFLSLCNFRFRVCCSKAIEVLKPVLLKSLHYLLIHLAMDPSLYSLKFGAANDSDRESHQSNFKVPFTNISTLSDFLFKELSHKFEQLFSGSERASPQLNILVHPEDLTLLLRCCMVMLRFLETNPGFFLEKCKILLAILGKLCSSDLMLHILCSLGTNEKHALRFKRSFSHQCVYANGSGFTTYVEEFNSSMCIVEDAGSPILFLCSLLEVFADELLLHQHLRQYFTIADSVSSASEKLFMCHSSYGDSYNVLEVISAHFLLSFSDEQACSKLHDASLWWHAKDSRTFKLSLIASLALLGSPVVFSAPKLFQAHLISMVSRAIGIDIAPQNTLLDLRIMDCYISALERSVMLYTQNMSSLQVGDNLIGVYTGKFSSVRPRILRGCNPSFECYIRPVTYNKINHKITELACSQQSCICDLDSRKKSDLLDASISFMKDNQSLLDNSLREEIMSILHCIISRILSFEFEGNATHKSGYLDFEEGHLLASTLKLLGSSLLQIVWCMRQNGSSETLKTLKDYSFCKEYDFIIDIIGCFQQCCVSQPVQKLFSDATGSCQSRHKESKLMFMHFAGLLLFSFAGELEFLWKGCIFMMMTLMNLFIFEEGSLDALRELLGLESLSSRSSIDKVSQVKIGRASSLIVASEFEKLQMLYLRKDTLSRYKEDEQHLPKKKKKEDEQDGTLSETPFEGAGESVEGIAEMTCNGEIFMKSTPEFHWKASDIDDLADFIECKQGKDYSKWLKNREKYRKWKNGKTVLVKRERKKSFMYLLH
ncbi:hypothetical protein NE237_022950 [Protea cynaroides]|uniref:DUF7812 domain-containing protein n=1 Tax=Protea cynaroides TaxID=273540 RepID=A0A9Q0HCY5_9MAGN|nr:hypothetical protein NE237_022950 [Protea cynaroides]